MPKRRCQTVLGLAGIIVEGLAGLLVVLLWVGLRELQRAIDAAGAMPAWEVIYA